MDELMDQVEVPTAAEVATTVRRCGPRKLLLMVVVAIGLGVAVTLWRRRSEDGAPT